MIQKKIIVRGIVQGVGFRPFCARVAQRLDLNGSVKNTSAGVEIILEGRDGAIENFISELWENPPSAAVVSDIKIEWEKVPYASSAFFDFTILESRRDDKQQVLIPPDISTCSQCLDDMRDPANRRYRYPFTNCTLCGPRYSIIESLPYDREKTTMKKFPMCPECEAEYHDPANRRFHAQPNACPVCGPKIDMSIEEITARLKRGEIVAIKGLGGFHIACIVDNAVVNELRKRKNRPAKPFAVMMRDIETAKKFVQISPEEQKILISPQSPIVLCKAHARQENIGVMLPYTPLHHLIMENFEMLVMTSANLSESPIISDNDEAREKLSGIVDAILTHDRDIEMAIDDSVISVISPPAPAGYPPRGGGLKIFLRRARGFVPNPINFGGSPLPILAAGADIKSAFALSQDDTIFPSQYLGDLRQLKTAEFYRRALRHFSKLYSITPKVLAHDAHPDYFSTRLGKEFVQEFGVEKIISVQHHAAHFAALLTENKTNEPAIGVIFDGIGYGADGTIWGGEFLINDGLRNFERVGTIFPCKMPGGDKSTEEPWRYALAMLETAGVKHDISDAKIEVVLKSLQHAPTSTSCGRLFDGVSALLSICKISTFEGQAAMALEECAVETEKSLNFKILDGELPMIDWRPAVREIMNRVHIHEPSSEIAGAFHNGLANAIVEMCKSLRKKHGISRVGLSGGVWQNKFLLEKTVLLLEKTNFKIILHSQLSPNDENIAVGQVAIASAMLFELYKVGLRVC